MIFIYACVLVASLSTISLSAQTPGPDGGTGFFSDGQTTLLARTGYNGTTTYRYLEAIYQKGRWIVPDAGYIDFGEPGAYREIWLGGGLVPYNGKHSILILENYFSQATGPKAGRALYAQPWFYFGLKPVRRVGGEAVYFVYLPLTGQGIRQYVLERAKLEYVVGNIKLGAGYAGYAAHGSRWHNRPFISTTLMTSRLGAFEFWIQRFADRDPPRSWQFQLRYAISIPK